LVRDATTTQAFDLGLIALGSIIVLGSYYSAERVYTWANTHGVVGIGLGLIGLAILAGLALLGGLLTLQGVSTGL